MESPNLPSNLHDVLVPGLPPSAYYISEFITPAEEAYLLQKINSVPQPQWRTLSHRRLQAQPSILSSSNTLLDAPLPLWLAEPIISRLLSLKPPNPNLSSQEPNAKPPNETNPPPTPTIFLSSPHARPNHVLINEYHPAQGILPHEDGPAYHPIVCTISLGSPVVYDAYPKSYPPEAFSTPPVPSEHAGWTTTAPLPEYQTGGKKAKWRIYQEPRSLLVTTREMYEGCLHGIEGVGIDEDVKEGEGGVVNWGLLREETRERVGRDGGRSERGTRVSLTFRDVVKVKKIGKVFGGLGRK